MGLADANTFSMALEEPDTWWEELTPPLKRCSVYCSAFFHDHSLSEVRNCAEIRGVNFWEWS